ncbi:MAG: regulatory protein RecX [Candidatus Berkelbacteria bacterium]|nr:regulatory protein RecX [Candidatus Berkelbacteria bacterium]
MKKLKILEYAFYLLELRDRSIGEMEEKFRRKEFDPKEIAETMKFLIDKNFLDDEKFAANFVRFKKSIKPVGKYYLQQKLVAKKIPKEIIEKTLAENIDEASEIAELADRWLTKNTKVPKEKIYQKLTRHLLSRGFEWEKVREVIAEKL